MRNQRAAHTLLASLALIAVSLATPAAAESTSGATPADASLRDQRARPPRAVPETSASAAADAGHLLPSVMTPAIFGGSAFATARSGYDSASRAFVARGVAEGSITRSLAVRLDFEHGPSMGPENRLRIGGRLQLLDQDKHGLDGAVALFYDPNEFREEGSIVAGLLVGGNLGRLSLFGDVLFGSDPEGDDRVLELRAAPLYRVSTNFHVGVDGRGRLNLSSDEKRNGTQTRDWEVQVLPTASVELGSFALVAEAGLSAERTTGPFGAPNEVSETRAGVLAMAGAAGAF
jgi:hypothetical protein